MPIDLTPFGFTATESQAYGALLGLGPSSGYSVAKALSIARANGYQALDGLVAKGAAVLLDEKPRRYRAVRAQDLFASIVQREAAKLDVLERQVAEPEADGASLMVAVAGLRALRDVVTRTILRADGPVECVAPADFLESLVPAWRARAAGGGVTLIWSWDRPPDLGGVDAGLVTPGAVTTLFDTSPTLVFAGGAALCAQTDPEATGYWTSDPVISRAVRATIASLTRS